MWRERYGEQFINQVVLECPSIKLRVTLYVCCANFRKRSWLLVWILEDYVSGTETGGTHNQRSKEKQTPEKTTPKALPTETGRAKTTNETPRPRSDSHETRSTGRLDHVSTRTRLAQRNTSTTEKPPTRTTLGRADRPTSLTNSKTKVRAFNATANHFLPPWLQR
jgi:hypothetical protein